MEWLTSLQHYGRQKRKRIVRRNKDSDGESTTLCSHDLIVPVNTAGGISFYCLSHSNRDA